MKQSKHSMQNRLELHWNRWNIALATSLLFIRIFDWIFSAGLTKSDSFAAQISASAIRHSDGGKKEDPSRSIQCKCTISHQQICAAIGSDDSYSTLITSGIQRSLISWLLHWRPAIPCNSSANDLFTPIPAANERRTCARSNSIGSY